MINILNTKEVLCEHLKKYHTGQEKAVSSKALEAAFQLNGREIRKCVNTLRQDGLPICSDGAGYYYAATQQEINNTIARLNSHITKVSNAKNGLLNSLLDGKPASVEIIIKINN